MTLYVVFVGAEMQFDSIWSSMSMAEIRRAQIDRTSTIMQEQLDPVSSLGLAPASPPHTAGAGPLLDFSAGVMGHPKDKPEALRG